MSITVAIVDDDDAILDAIKMVLAVEPWTIKTYASGEAFLANLNGVKLDCVIIDPHLPGISGVEVARKLANDFQVPIIGLTARPDSPLTKKVMAAGARVMLKKPVSAAELVDQIRAVIEATSEAQ